MSSQDLQVLYQQTIRHHQDYLKKVHDAFNHRCDEIKKEGEEKINNAIDDEEKQQLVDDQKAKLTQTLSELKQAINVSNREALKKLEQIENQMQADELNLDELLKGV